MIFLFTLCSHTHSALVGLQKYTRTAPVKITADRVEIHCLKLKQLVMLRDRIIAARKKSPQFRRRVAWLCSGTVPGNFRKFHPIFSRQLTTTLGNLPENPSKKRSHGKPLAHAHQANFHSRTHAYSRGKSEKVHDGDGENSETFSFFFPEKQNHQRKNAA